jgi:hypothetical protein
MEKPELYHLKPSETPRKQPQPAVVTAIKAGLHPSGKIAQVLLGNNQKKTNG